MCTVGGLQGAGGHAPNRRLSIGGFRDRYLGRKVVSRPVGPRAGMGSVEGLGERCELP